MKTLSVETKKYIHYFSVPDDIVDLVECFNNGGPMREVAVVKKCRSIEIARFMNLAILKKVN